MNEWKVGFWRVFSSCSKIDLHCVPRQVLENRCAAIVEKHSRAHGTALAPRPPAQCSLKTRKTLISHSHRAEGRMSYLGSSLLQRPPTPTKRANTDLGTQLRVHDQNMPQRPHNKRTEVLFLHRELRKSPCADRRGRIRKENRAFRVPHLVDQEDGGW